MVKRRGRHRFKGRATLPKALRDRVKGLWWIIGAQQLFALLTVVSHLVFKSAIVGPVLLVLLLLYNSASVWWVLSFRARIRRWIHAFPAACAGCDYPLLHESAACAECGVRATVQERVLRRYLRRHRMWFWA